jgi:hypothetical protein
MKNTFISLASVLFIFFALVGFVHADLGPKPTVDIDVSYDNKPVSDLMFGAKMLSCDNKEPFRNIEDTSPGYLEHFGLNMSKLIHINEYDPVKNCHWRPAPFAWGGECKDSKCSFNYHPPIEFRLAVYIPSLNKVFITNEISRNNFNSNYKAELRPDGSAKISETTPFFQWDIISSFIKALIITLIMELFFGLIYLSFARLPTRILLSIFIVNFISLPIVWFIFPVFKITWLVITLAEIFAFVFEAYFIHHFNKDVIALKNSFGLSFTINLASLSLGAFIYIIISSFF